VDEGGARVDYEKRWSTLSTPCKSMLTGFRVDRVDLFLISFIRKIDRLYLYS